jgi:hypothetical protein
MPTLSLNDIINVTLTVSPVAIIRAGYNLGLIIGKSTIISAVTRVKTYASLAEMIADGWTGSEVEYLAAQAYFAQNPRPQKIAIGRWDGTGAETALQAITACRAANTDWYAAMFASAIVKADITAIAAYIESAIPVSAFFFTTADADVPLGTAGNVFLTLKASAYRRTTGMYSATANNIASVLGYAMGAMTELQNSAYTLANKAFASMAVDALTTTQITNILNAYGNVYVNRGSTYNVYQNGYMASGTAFDEVINLDVLTNDIQTNVMTLLQSATKIPQTEGGVTSIVNAITTACENAVSRNILAPGIWTGAPVLNVSTGDFLSKGYLIMADTIANQSANDRAARKSPPIYVLVKMAGAVQSVVINVNVNQ